jgi:hypothetical protein
MSPNSCVQAFDPAKAATAGGAGFPKELPQLTPTRAAFLR